MSLTYDEVRLKIEQAVRDGDAQEALRLSEELGRARTAEKDVCYLINLSPLTISLTAGRQFWIQGRQPGRQYGVTRIEKRVERMDLGNKRVMEVPIFADEIATDLARMANSNIGEGFSYAGVFVSFSPTPNPEDLEKARDDYTRVLKKWVQEGDNLWSATHRYTDLPDYMRRAVKELGLNKEWAYDPQVMQSCDGCGESVPAGVAICKSCGAILNEEKARRLYPERFAQAVAEAPVEAAPATAPRRKKAHAEQPPSE